MSPLILKTFESFIIDGEEVVIAPPIEPCEVDELAERFIVLMQGWIAAGLKTRKFLAAEGIAESIQDISDSFRMISGGSEHKLDIKSLHYKEVEALFICAKKGSLGVYTSTQNGVEETAINIDTSQFSTGHLAEMVDIIGANDLQVAYNRHVNNARIEAVSKKVDEALAKSEKTEDPEEPKEETQVKARTKKTPAKRKTTTRRKTTAKTNG